MKPAKNRPHRPAPADTVRLGTPDTERRPVAAQAGRQATLGEIRSAIWEKGGGFTSGETKPQDCRKAPRRVNPEPPYNSPAN